MTTAEKKVSEFKTFYNGQVEIEIKPWGDYFRYIKVGTKGGMLSPSAVTKNLDKSRALIPWAIGLVASHITSSLEERKSNTFTKDEIFMLVDEARKKPEEKKVEGGGAGDLIHDYAHEFAKAVLSGASLPTIDHLDKENEMHAKAINGISAFLEFYNNNDVEFIKMEDPIYYNSFLSGETSEEDVIEFAGRLDLVARVNGNLEVLDYKTSKGVYSDQRYQVSGYFKSWNTNHGEEEQAKGYRILNFSKETGDLIEKYVPAEEVERDFNAYKGLYAVAIREKELDAEYRDGLKDNK